MKSADDPLTPYPNVKRSFTAIEERPRSLAGMRLERIKKVNHEERKSALFASNYPATDD
jgi:hypothetical protein